MGIPVPAAPGANKTAICRTCGVQFTYRMRQKYVCPDCDKHGMRQHDHDRNCKNCGIYIWLSADEAAQYGVEDTYYPHINHAIDGHCTGCALTDTVPIAQRDQLVHTFLFGEPEPMAVTKPTPPADHRLMGNNAKVAEGDQIYTGAAWKRAEPRHFGISAKEFTAVARFQAPATDKPTSADAASAGVEPIKWLSFSTTRKPMKERDPWTLLVQSIKDSAVKKLDVDYLSYQLADADQLASAKKRVGQMKKELGDLGFKVKVTAETEGDQHWLYVKLLEVKNAS